MAFKLATQRVQDRDHTRTVVLSEPSCLIDDCVVQGLRHRVELANSYASLSALILSAAADLDG